MPVDGGPMGLGLSPALRVVTGEVIAYRLFDIAYAVDLTRAQALWRARAGGESARKKLSATPMKAVSYDVPPVALALEPVKLVMDEGGVAGGAIASVTARVYDFGVVSVALSIAADGLDWEAFSARMNAVVVAVNTPDGLALWAGLKSRITALIGDALVRPTQSTLEEDYTIGLVRGFDRPVSAQTIEEQFDLVPLLSGEQRRLSEGARADLLRNRFSYYTDDLTVLTWDRAFIYEPRGDSDVIDVLEVANAQLLEMRYYDELLDDELPRMHDLVETSHRATSLVSSRKFAKLARRLYALFAEVTELTEKVDNALQVTEDVYLARIYAAALDLFRVQVVSAAVDRKLATIQQTYTALYDEASSARAAVMEMAIVGLIIIEIVVALMRGRGRQGQGLCPRTPTGVRDPRPHELEGISRVRCAASNSWGLGSLTPTGSRGRALGLAFPLAHPRPRW